jgi:putative DNA primase/helicase
MQHMSISETDAAVKSGRQNSIQPASQGPSEGARDGDKSTNLKIPAAWILPDPDAETTSPTAVYEAAMRYRDAGLSVVPIAADGSKRPDPTRLPRLLDEQSGQSKFSWKIYQVRRPRPEEIQRWYDQGGQFGLAVLGGVVSGGQRGLGLEVLDFDTFELAQPWMEAVEREVPGLVNRLVRVQSPRPGMHVYYRCSEFGGNQKLACDASVGEGGKRKPVTRIESKGEGGYCLVPPSPRECHPRCKVYRVVQGSPDLTQVPVITPAERSVLMAQARAFNRWEEPVVRRVWRPKARVPCGRGGRPGDDFNERGDWSEILKPHGWVMVGRSGGEEFWRRPGKSTGQSATVNYENSGLLYVFSENADPFEANHAYTKFAAYVLLGHDGDFEAAARALGTRGYGGYSLPHGQRAGQAA